MPPFSLFILLNIISSFFFYLSFTYLFLIYSSFNWSNTKLVLYLKHLSLIDISCESHFSYKVVRRMPFFIFIFYFFFFGLLIKLIRITYVECYFRMRITKETAVPFMDSLLLPTKWRKFLFFTNTRCIKLILSYPG